MSKERYWTLFQQSGFRKLSDENVVMDEPCIDQDGNIGYSLYVAPSEMATEVVLTKEELRQMLDEIYERHPFIDLEHYDI